MSAFHSEQTIYVYISSKTETHHFNSLFSLFMRFMSISPSYIEINSDDVHVVEVGKTKLDESRSFSSISRESTFERAVLV